jgi:phosphoribosyl-AMP cyclohydrolase
MEKIPPISDAWLEQIRWNEHGLVAVIAQEFGSKDVLMLAWMNREALSQTLQKGQAVYWSRSRKQLWHKGEESGHTQAIREVRLDCDGDTILLIVDQKDRIACHTGKHSCFFNEWDTVAQHWVQMKE